MKAVIIGVLSMLISSVAGASLPDTNPLLNRSAAPFETPPFDLIRAGHFLPAYNTAIEANRVEIKAIADNPAAPSFANTIEALDNSGVLLVRIDRIFNGIRGANTNDALDSIANAVTPLITRHRNDVLLNGPLFKRIKAVNEQRSKLALTAEQKMLLDNTYKDFVRGGANLTATQQTSLRAINEELSLLQLKFGQNLLKETNTWKLVIENSADLAGLPPASIQAAADAARSSGLDGRWVFTLQKPSLIPFLQYAQNRTLREKIFRAYCMRGDNGNASDNKVILERMVSLRTERAHLLGFANHAEYVLDVNMAKNPAAVYDLLNTVWTPALAIAKKERDAMQAMIRKEGGTFTLQPWDWWYYAAKVQKAEYDLDEDALRPYFSLENVRKGAFDVAGRLYGLRFIRRNDIPTYADHVEVYEVQGQDGHHIGILYTDYFPRAGKGPGAWMDSFRDFGRVGGTTVTPVVYNVGNFSMPSGNEPALLSMDEVETLFHEFGHALFGLLSNRSYRNLDLTRDGIELPSQIMENWAHEPAVMKMYFRHYRTGAPMPDSLIQRITKAGTFNQGFATVEYLAASYLDMDWHTIKDTTTVDATAFEKASMNRIGLIPEIVSRYRSTYFNHIFGGDYSAGYYSYLWAEVLDADAFEAFKEKGIFDKATADAFRINILERGGTEDPMALYEKFRGTKPSITPLLKRRGLAN
jgi:peptidyl-dipeptidase Dcp